jgi:hypothetical protein
MVDGAATRGSEFDLEGFVGLRLVDADDRDRARVVAQLGPIQAPLERQPDITVRFVDQLEHGPLTYVEWPESAFDSEAFYLLTGRDRIDAKTKLPFEAIGRMCEIVCERRLRAVPLLLAVINATALSKGLLPLHASAFVHEGRGILVTGWAKGGKTEMLLAFMGRGAQYIGDEWVYLTPDGRMFGIPEPIRLWRWQLRQLPQMAARLPRGQRLRLGVVEGVASVGARLTPGGGGGIVGSVLRRSGPVLRRQANVQVPPTRLFGPDRIAREARMDTVVFVSSHAMSEIVVDDIDPDDLAQRMASSLARERHELLERYGQFRFAFPDRRSDLLEHASEIELTLLRNAFAGRRIAWVRHPYPVDIASLVPSIEARIEADAG